MQMEIFLHWVFRHFSFVRQHLGYVFVVQPLHLEVKVHVLRTLAQAFFGVCCNADATRYDTKLSICAQKLTIICIQTRKCTKIKRTKTDRQNNKMSNPLSLLSSTAC